MNQFTVKIGEILEPLKAASCATPKKHTDITILRNVLFNVKKESIVFIGTDLEYEIRAFAKVDTGINWSFTINAKKILGICTSYDSETKITFKESPSRIEGGKMGKLTLLVGKNSRYMLSELPATDFPKFPEFKDPNHFDITESDLQIAINKIGFSMGNGNERRYLNGMLLQLTKNKLTAVTTDGHRLGITNTQIDFPIKDPINAIIPRNAVNDLLRVVSDNGNMVKVAIADRFASFNIGSVFLTTKLIDGVFPDYEQAIPQNTSAKMTVNAKVMSDALSRVAVLKDKICGVHLSLNKNLIKLNSYNEKQEEVTEEFDAEYSNGNIDIGFNVTYLSDIMKNAENNIEFEFAGSESGCLVLPQDTKNIKYVVMPIRL